MFYYWSGVLIAYIIELNKFLRGTKRKICFAHYRCISRQNSGGNFLCGKKGHNRGVLSGGRNFSRHIRVTSAKSLLLLKSSKLTLTTHIGKTYYLKNMRSDPKTQPFTFTLHQKSILNKEFKIQRVQNPKSSKFKEFKIQRVQRVQKS